MIETKINHLEKLETLTNLKIGLEKHIVLEDTNIKLKMNFPEVYIRNIIHLVICF